MPVYEMECQDCKEVFDKFCSVAVYTEGKIECPECKSINTKQMIKGVPFYFKGGAPSNQV